MAILCLRFEFKFKLKKLLIAFGLRVPEGKNIWKGQSEEIFGWEEKYLATIVKWGWHFAA